MRLCEENGERLLYKEKECIGRCRFTPCPQGADITLLTIVPQWRRRGYGSYLLKSVLADTGGYDRNGASLHTLPPPAEAGAERFYARFGFVPAGEVWQRQRRPDLTAVQLAADLLRLYAPHPLLCVDATCGNGNDTETLCRMLAPGGRVVAMDIQRAACDATAARLKAAGFAETQYMVVCDSHEHLLQYVQPGTADMVLFNFGWLPGADHSVYSTEASSLPALQAALEALRPGGLLSAVLYSGKVIGSGEKQAVLAWLRSLPLSRYTVLECRFANWADTAPLPCLVVKKP